ncbi:hypothetical protein RhiirA5_367345 [Rhizophagus irregularis]|uniref:Uncharacterized protein n=1 Tax=Rhizophagus irregularis TaxID=588596 RepID=A0A2I1FI86_9GLOM|nr:hypothetical protein RhiirA5_367345 [Rhizophagus irregularis]PKC55024.1 hypothetical protein RhiirA1_429690 [Rhizophagus irregularis]PKY34104.1 hypothetical protein RhiirB3_420745 [Rhizophagus irregularis]CAB4492170.1 unnamed protein product [Rhizophagus irregularis]CAB5124170.1 unnamed protein product [Rhizophagus irregularis]
MSAGVYKIPIIDIAALLAKIIKELGNVARKVTVAIKNETSLILENPKIYYRFGNSPYDACPLAPVNSGKAVVWGACKTPYAFRGTEGVIMYHIKDKDKSLAFMWKVPYARSNGWFIKVYDGFISPSIEIFHELRDKCYSGGDGIIHEGTLDDGLYYKGSMGGTGEPHLEVVLQYCNSKIKTG